MSGVVERAVLTALASLFIKKIAATAIYVAFAWARHWTLAALRRPPKKARPLNSAADRPASRKCGLHVVRERKEPIF